ncbi:MAG: TolC family protein [Nitrospirota bacterium]|nr:TolC family protein [Nitrospirota bacterium]
MNRLRVAPLLLLLAACAAGPDPAAVGDAPAAPPGWSAKSQADGAVTGGWLAEFGVPQLEALVAEALAANPDLAIAAARLDAARARARMAGAPRLPQVTTGFNAARSKRSPSGLAAGSTPPVTRFDLDATVKWEVDLWGRLRAGARAAVAQRGAAAADWNAARLSLAAAVTRGWFQLAEAQAQLELAERTVASFERSRNVVEDRYRSGLSSALDVHLARENAATARGTLAQRNGERDNAARTLEALLGRYPAAELAAAPVLPERLPPVPAGLPAELLDRRPDLAASRLRLLAAGWEHTAARRARLPSVGLTATGGTASDVLRNLLDWDYLVWSLLGNVTQPLFAGGRIAAQAELADAGQREAFYIWAGDVLAAFSEVERALSAETDLGHREAALAVAAGEAEQASDLAISRYREGLTDIVTLLEAQRRAFNARSAHLRTTRERVANRVDLVLALGGDFQPVKSADPVSPMEEK